MPELSSTPTMSLPETPTPNLFAKRALSLGLRAAGSLLAAGIVMAPAAAEYGLEHAQVQDAIGEFPTTFSYTGNGQSRLKAAATNASIPKSQYGVGLKADVEGLPPQRELGDYITPTFWKNLAAQYPDPGQAVNGYKALLWGDLKHEATNEWLRTTGLAGGTLFAIGLGLSWGFREARIPKKRALTLAVAGTALALGSNSWVSYERFENWGNQEYVAPKLYTPKNLEDTPFAGVQVDSLAVSQVIDNGAQTLGKYLDRQNEQNESFVASMETQLDEQIGQVAAPRDGEAAMLAFSDMHSNRIGTKFLSGFVERYNDLHPDALRAILNAGDPTYGTAGENPAIEAQAEAADGLPEIAIGGNHASKGTLKQMLNAGITLAEDKRLEVAGLQIIGRSDPVYSPLFAPNVQRYNASQAEVGQEVRTAAQEENTDILLVHEGYMAAAALDIDDIHDLRKTPDDTSYPFIDTVPDAPFKMVFYGHWHEEVDPQTIYNSDGSWTTVFELGSAGGAIGNPTFAHFSLPNAIPKLPASSMLIFYNETAGLPTGYARMVLQPTGEVVLGPRIELGTFTGQLRSVGNHK